LPLLLLLGSRHRYATGWWISLRVLVNPAGKQPRSFIGKVLDEIPPL
jgi:hypothetical protein